MVRNYVAKIAFLAILRQVELKNTEFNIDEFLKSLGQPELKDFQQFDKYPIKDYGAYTLALLEAVDHDESFFLKVGLDGLASKIGSYSFFIQNSPNFKALISKSSQYSHILTDLISNIDIDESEDSFKVHYHFSRDFQKLTSQCKAPLIEMCFGGTVALYNDFAYSKDHKLQFFSSIKHPMSDEDVTSLIGHKFVSGADGDYIIFPNEVKSIPNLRYEKDLPQGISVGLSKHVEAQNVGSLVAIITNLLELKPASSLDDISEELHISKRTLQRRLQDQDINFTVLKQNAANQKSMELLDGNQHSVEEIASLLGYSNSASFIHAFTNWNGMSPTAYRKGDK